MDSILRVNINEVPYKHKNEHKDYEYFKHVLIPAGSSLCAASLYEIPPKKAAYPYHFHVKNEEMFYIISGTGLLKTPEGERTVSAGDFLFFPPNENGAHKLTNNSESEKLVYLDFGTRNDLDAAFYPDSNKIGVWGKDINKLYTVSDDKDYYYSE